MNTKKTPYVESRLIESNCRFELALASLRSPELDNDSVVSVSDNGYGAMICEGIGDSKHSGLFASAAAYAGLCAIDSGLGARDALKAASEASRNVNVHIAQRCGGASGCAIALMQNGIEWAAQGNIGVFLIYGGKVRMLSTPAESYGDSLTSYLGQASLGATPIDSGYVSIPLPEGVLAIATGVVSKELGKHRISTCFEETDDLESMAVSILRKLIDLGLEKEASVLLARPISDEIVSKD
ncbi:MAG: hypothetical protein ACI4B9_02910 [Eggerthellaceae bacterium]